MQLMKVGASAAATPRPLGVSSHGRIRSREKHRFGVRTSRPGGRGQGVAAESLPANSSMHSRLPGVSAPPKHDGFGPGARTVAPAGGGARKRVRCSAASGPGGFFSVVEAKLPFVVSFVTRSYDRFQGIMLSLIESTLSSIQNLIIGMVTMMNNPWQPADIWFPVVWLLTHKAILKSIHKVWRVLKCNIIRSCEPYMDDSFKDSFLGSLCQPMTSLGWVFILLYLYDNIVLTMRGMGMAIPLDSTIINGFDGAVYSAWLATTVLQLKDRWFASIQYSAGITHAESVVIDKLLSIGIIIFGVAACMGALGLRAGAIGLASVGGLALSLASRDLIENLISGVILLTKRPFNVGDVIAGGPQEEAIMGLVMDIGWFTTYIRLTGDTALVTVPNSTLTRNSIKNLSRRSHRVASVDFVVPNRSPEVTRRLVKKLKRALKDISVVDHFDRFTYFPGAIRNPYHKPRVWVNRILPEGLEISILCLVGPIASPSTGGSTRVKALTELSICVESVLEGEGIWVPPPIRVLRYARDDDGGSLGLTGEGVEVPRLQTVLRANQTSEQALLRILNRGRQVLQPDLSKPNMFDAKRTFDQDGSL